MRGMQLMMTAINPGKAKGLEAKVLALSRDFNELLSEKMRAAILFSMLLPDLQHALIQQADKIEDYKSTRDRVATIVEAKLALKNLTPWSAMRSTGQLATRKLGRTGLRCRRGEQQKRFVLLQVRRTRPHCSKVRHTRPNQGERER